MSMSQSREYSSVFNNSRVEDCALYGVALLREQSNMKKRREVSFSKLFCT